VSCYNTVAIKLCVIHYRRWIRGRGTHWEASTLWYRSGLRCLH